MGAAASGIILHNGIFSFDAFGEVGGDFWGFGFFSIINKSEDSFHSVSEFDKITNVNQATTLSLMNGRALAVIAHPDDELIWMGGVIFLNRNIKWTIFSLCRGDDPDRAPRFRNACRTYGAKWIISDLEDEKIMSTEESVPEIKRRIKNRLKNSRFNYIFTHGSKGEYGHPRHKDVSLAVGELLKSGSLKAKEVYIFDYLLDERKGYCVAGDGEAKIKLPYKIFKKKKDILQKIYGFTKDSFEAKSCSRIETFDTLKI